MPAILCPLWHEVCNCFRPCGEALALPIVVGKAPTIPLEMNEGSLAGVACELRIRASRFVRAALRRWHQPEAIAYPGSITRATGEGMRKVLDLRSRCLIRLLALFVLFSVLLFGQPTF